MLADEIKGKVILTDTTPLKGVCLSLWSDVVDQLEIFKHLCYGNLPKEMHWFHQCNTRNYQMFEFWKPHKKAAEQITEIIATAMGLEYKIHLTKLEDPDWILPLRPFVPFDVQFHTYGQFFG